MFSEDIPYYRQRVLAERVRAAEAATPQVAAVHTKLAHLYESLTERLERSQCEQDLAPLSTDSQKAR
nr:hypothetical protein [uncultured Sphingomonas sp.]